MAVAVFGGAVLGAAFGEVFAVLHDTVKNVGSKALVFKSELKSLKSTLDLLAPVVKEISQSNRDVGRSEEETKSLIEDMKKAEELIRTCSAISGWTIIFQAHHSKQLTELNKDIVKFCQVQMPAQTKRDTSQILRYTQSLEDKSSQILGNTSQISQILEDTSSQILGNTSQILGNTSQISHILEDKSSQILGNTSQISQILEDTSSQILGNTSQILGNTSQISQILEDKSSQISQILEDTSSQILGNTSQISQILEDKSSQILGNTSQILDVLITGFASISLMTSLSTSKTPSSSLFSYLTPRRRYDVFLNFRGGDTRKNFADLLYVALERNGVVTFRDEEMVRGSSAGLQLKKGIEESMFAIVLLSRNYASSTWCLSELQMIFSCKRETGMRILPIFYDVNPSDVQKQRGHVEEAFREHEEHFEDNNEKVETWRAALTDVTNLRAWNSTYQFESNIIQSVVEEISHAKSYTF